jgi:hypothetical protein
MVRVALERQINVMSGDKVSLRSHHDCDVWMKCFQSVLTRFSLIIARGLEYKPWCAESSSTWLGKSKVFTSQQPFVWV